MEDAPYLWWSWNPMWCHCLTTLTALSWFPLCDDLMARIFFTEPGSWERAWGTHIYVWCQSLRTLTTLSRFSLQDDLMARIIFIEQTYKLRNSGFLKKNTGSPYMYIVSQHHDPHRSLSVYSSISRNPAIWCHLSCDIHHFLLKYPLSGDLMARISVSSSRWSDGKDHLCRTSLHITES